MGTRNHKVAKTAAKKTAKVMVEVAAPTLAKAVANRKVAATPARGVVKARPRKRPEAEAVAVTEVAAPTAAEVRQVLSQSAIDADLSDRGPVVSSLRRALAAEQRKNALLVQGRYRLVEEVAELLSEWQGVELPDEPAKRSASPAARVETALLHISDVQLGKVTKTYNTEVAMERLVQLAIKTVQETEIRRRGGAVIDEIHVCLGGDIVEGEDIFPHQAHLIDQAVLDQAVHSAPTALVRVIVYLLKHFRKVKVFAVVGNHGRAGWTVHPKTNWDRVAYEVTRITLLGTEEQPRRELANRLEFTIAEDFYYIDDIYGYGCLFVHGDQIGKGTTAPFPFTGTNRKAWGWIDAIPGEWTYLYFGHWHTYASMALNGERHWFANGTTESDNDYAQEKLAASGRPIQRLQFFAPNVGIVADIPVKLE